uniref:Uncharacterized protein n=1 Tax=Chenopodium quinoa TaxID=63459 RepID=A0A803NF04_CHEQI
MTLLVIIPASLLLLFLAYNLFERFRYKLPPGPKPWPVVGNIYDIGPVRCQCFHEWAQKYGPILSFRLGTKLNVIVSNAELAKQVLKENDQTLADRHRSRSSARFSKDGKDLIWADYGPHYVKVRKACTLELFTQKRLEALRPIREDEVTAMIESLFNDCTKPGKEFNILSSGFKSSKTSFLAEHLPWLRWLLVPLDKEKGEAAVHNTRLDRFTREIMEEHAKAKSQNIGGVKQHFVDALLGLKDEYDLSEDTVIGLLWDMVIAGMDTVSISVEWALAELIKNPRVQKKAQEELDRVIGQDRIMTEEDFSNLPYLQALAKESLRLHPPTPLMLPHKAKAHVKIGGYDVPKARLST